jgi:hypothetical protein
VAVAALMGAITANRLGIACIFAGLGAVLLTVRTYTCAVRVRALLSFRHHKPPALLPVGDFRYPRGCLSATGLLLTLLQHLFGMSQGGIGKAGSGEHTGNFLHPFVTLHKAHPGLCPATML